MSSQSTSRALRRLALALLLGVSASLVGVAGASAATGAIKGEVTALAGGAPIEDVEVCAYQVSGDFEGEECTRSEADGTYEVAGLPAGEEYKVEFGPRFGLNYLTQYYNDEESFELADKITVNAGATVEDIDAQMRTGGEIEGEVTAAATGDPVAEVEVCALEVPEEEAFGCGETGSDGKYTIARLKEGEYKVEFFPFFTGLNLQVQYYNDETSWEAADPVTVALGAPTTNIDAALEAGVELSGSVFAASNNAALREVLVCSVATASGTLTRCAETSPFGHYALTGMPSGSYKVAFSLEFREFFPGEGFEAEDDGYLTRFYNEKSTLAAADPISALAGTTRAGIDAHLLTPQLGRSTVTAVAPPAPPKVIQPPRPALRLKCRKGFKKRRVRGKVRCVKTHRRHHQRAR